MNAQHFLAAINEAAERDKTRQASKESNESLALALLVVVCWLSHLIASHVLCLCTYDRVICMYYSYPL